MRPPRELFLFPLTGLFDECHRIDLAGLRRGFIEPTGKSCLRPINNIWWREALSRPTLELIVSRLQSRYRYTSVKSLQHRAILAAPEKFYAAVEDAPRDLANLGGGARHTFSALETLQIFCSVYSDVISTPISLSLQEGLVLNELSSRILLQEVLNPATNPYLPFIDRHVCPVLRHAPLDLVWIVGPIKASTLAMAIRAKELYPDCHVSVTGHSTEYYSLNKIAKYLKRNTRLFEVIDSIVLDDFENTMPQLVDCLAGHHSLESVPNLLYVDRTGADSASPTALLPILKTGADNGPIKQTPCLGGRQSIDWNTHRHPTSVLVEDRSDDHVDPGVVADSRLWPNAKCYWDQCNFCGINRKYQTLGKSVFDDAELVASFLQKLASEGVEYVWSFDEAIPPKALGELAQSLLQRGVKVEWQTRSKIDKGFTSEICDLLGRAGLREIRLGLESASPRVLSCMGKFPVGWSLELVEQIVHRFHVAGVSVHFPTIIGFPTETQAERAETFAFLRRLVERYPSVTFNMNILGLDVASKLVENYEDFGITTLRWPAPANEFLGNLLDWDCAESPFDYDALDAQRNDLMRRLLYPWMPATASVPTYIFYRLAETSRATMVWKAKRSRTGNWRDEMSPLDVSQPLVLSPKAAITSSPKIAGSGRYFVYDWNTHHNFECDETTHSLIMGFSSPTVLATAESVTDGTDQSEVESPDRTVRRLYRMGVIEQAPVGCSDARAPEGQTDRLVSA